jgi:hypothetical protein
MIAKHLEYINAIRPKIEALGEKVLKPKDFYFVGWYGGKSEDEYEDEKDVCRFAVVLKSTFDARDGCWEDGEPEATLIQALKIPLYYESGCVYAFRDLMDTVSRLLGGQPQDTSAPKHSPQDIRSLFLAAGFQENPQVILVWNKRARIVE